MYQPNPVNDFYLRNAYQQPPYQQTFNFPPHQPPVPQIKSSWVSSVEEAKASQIDFSSTNLFLDTATGKIYLKRIGDNGKPQFHTYRIEEEIQTDPLEEIKLRLSNIESVLGGLRNESVPSNASVQQSVAVSQPAVTAENESNGPAESAGIPKNAGNDKWQKRR